MIGNFLYFIVVLLIYSVYVTIQPSIESEPGIFETIALFGCLLVIFTGFNWFYFRRLEKRIIQEEAVHSDCKPNLKPSLKIDHTFNTAVTRQSVMAVVLFAINIYGLNLPYFFSNVLIFNIIPTLQALFFIAVFVFYLSIVWGCAYGCQQKLYKTGMSRRSYILSNISISIPILIPWFFLSGIADLVDALPFEFPKRFLATTEGEIIYLLVILFTIAVFGPAMIQKFWRCKPLETGIFRSRIEDFCRKADMEYANILLWPIYGGNIITAGVMGLVKKFRYILVTSALLRVLEPGEVDAVIAHEIGHVKKKHLLLYMFFMVGFIPLTFIPYNLSNVIAFYSEPVILFFSSNMNYGAVSSVIWGLLMVIFFVLYFRYVFGYFMRNFERQADIYVYRLLDDAQPLISTFKKIALFSGQAPDRKNWHHFSISERMEYLNKCEADKKWITRQDQKIKKSIALYIACMLLVGWAGYSLSSSETGKALNREIYQKIVLSEIEKDPDNVKLYHVLGDIYYERKDYAGTIHAYRRALSLEPESPEILNNLAWLYATCANESFRDYGKALDFARKASELDIAPHILDTLAESFYVNGKYKEAIQAGQLALEQVKENRGYYKEQLEKFTMAGNEHINIKDISFK